MTYEKYPLAYTETQSFDCILDTACDRLREKHIQYSIKRIREMDEELIKIEKELDEFFGNNTDYE